MGRNLCSLALFYLVLHVSIPFCGSTSAQRQDAKTDSTGMLRTLREVLSDLSMDAHRYVVSLVGEQAVDTSLKVIKQYAMATFQVCLLGRSRKRRNLISSVS